MRSIFSTSTTVFTLLSFFLTQASSSLAQDGSGFAHQANVRLIKRQSSSSASSSSTTVDGTSTSILSTIQTSLSSVSSSSASAKVSGASGYGYGITSNNGTGSSQADGFGYEVCLLKELICLGDAAAFAIAYGGKGDGYGGALNGAGDKGSVAQAGANGIGIAAADAANLCIKDACMGLAGAIAYGSASAAAQGGDLTTTLLIGPTNSMSASLNKPTQSFSTITAASEVPTHLLPALLGGVKQLVEIKSLHARAQPTPIV